jgi:hypothetical protein
MPYFSESGFEYLFERPRHKYHSDDGINDTRIPVKSGDEFVYVDRCVDINSIFGLYILSDTCLFHGLFDVSGYGKALRDGDEYVFREALCDGNEYSRRKSFRRLRAL